MENRIDEFQDILDVRDIIERVEELEDMQADESADGEELQELATLSKLLEDMRGYGGDEQWRGEWYPITLIRDDYFTDYAQELVTDCGYISPDFPGWIAIDWEATARAVQMDYSSVEYNGVTYWYR